MTACTVAKLSGPPASASSHQVSRSSPTVRPAPVTRCAIDSAIVKYQR